jgi:hypothetical protein
MGRIASTSYTYHVVFAPCGIWLQSLFLVVSVYQGVASGGSVMATLIFIIIIIIAAMAALNVVGIRHAYFQQLSSLQQRSSSKLTDVSGRHIHNTCFSPSHLVYQMLT